MIIIIVSILLFLLLILLLLLSLLSLLLLLLFCYTLLPCHLPFLCTQQDWICTIAMHYTTCDSRQKMTHELLSTGLGKQYNSNNNNNNNNNSSNNNNDSNNTIHQLLQSIMLSLNSNRSRAVPLAVCALLSPFLCVLLTLSPRSKLSLLCARSSLCRTHTHTFRSLILSFTRFVSSLIACFLQALLPLWEQPNPDRRHYLRMHHLGRHSAQAWPRQGGLPVSSVRCVHFCGLV